jgi:glycosidase
MPRRAPVVRLLLALVASLVAVAGVAAPVGAAPTTRGQGVVAAKHSLRSPVTDENFYFVMADRFANGSTANDTGGYGADPLVSGFDPTKKGFYNGGDLEGLLDKLDYIEGLGTDSIWLTPSFKNKPVQLEDGPSAGYHGYWITDFTQIDPHLGTNQDLKDLVDAAHARGMKVYFDIITNHTADVIGYDTGARKAYVSKDQDPYTDASGEVFDDRDYAGTGTFPELSAATSFPEGYTPVLGAGETNLKVPAWLNDVRLYHNRGDTTFVGENSQYGDFFGLDDLFTEHPTVVAGMIDIYEKWIKDVGVDGFRIDTMKHVDDEFWQAFGPSVLQYAKDQGKPEFFMFGEVAYDGFGARQKADTSLYTTRNQMQSVLDFPFADVARDFASRSGATSHLDQFFDDDDWYTDGDSNAYQLPTFLGNHDRGRIGHFIASDNPGAGDTELLRRDQLAHELMYFSRGNPVVYYGDEQGFTGTGGDQLARQTMFASQVPEYLDDDLIGTTATHAQDNFVPTHPMYQTISSLAQVTEQHPALRDGAQQSRTEGSGSAGVYAFSRLDRTDQHEYVVATNNSESAASASFRTFLPSGSWTKVYGPGAPTETTDAARSMSVDVPGLSTVVYRSDTVIPASPSAPSVSLSEPTPTEESQGRIHVRADVDGSSFYEVTFYAKHGDQPWRSIGTDDSAPYQVYDDVSSELAGTKTMYRAVVLDNAGHSSKSKIQQSAVPAPELTIEFPPDGWRVRDTAEIRAVADPERADHVVTFERSIDGGAWTDAGTDDSSPVYTLFDDLSALDLAEGTPITYRATLHYAGGGTVSAEQTVTAASPTPYETATLHYLRPAGDYGDPPGDGWGLHMWGDAVDPAVLSQIAWDNPWPRTGVTDGWADYEIPLVDDTKPVNFIMHLPGGDSVPTTREPGGDRSFVPLQANEVWIVQGDPTVYTSQPNAP